MSAKSTQTLVEQLDSDFWDSESDMEKCNNTQGCTLPPSMYKTTKEYMSTGDESVESSESGETSDDDEEYVDEGDEDYKDECDDECDDEGDDDYDDEYESDNNDDEGERECKFVEPNIHALSDPNQYFFVDSLIELRMNGFTFHDKKKAQNFFDQSLANMYNGIILYPSLKTAIVFPCGLFLKKRMPEYKYDFPHIKANFYIANNREVPSFMRDCLCFRKYKNVIYDILDYYND